ncbi:MAG TPA: zinc-ribbon domain-containing protein [Sphingomicrobium sp.]|nr:zinc-ribbon domain-containing protein [Sphingomicrobium sp.]
MILTCPACGTQYVVKDGAIPEAGRKVRCASCRHSWHQDPPPLELEAALAAEADPEDQEFASPFGDGSPPGQPAEPASPDDYGHGDDHRGAEIAMEEPERADTPADDEFAEVDHLAEERAAVAPVAAEPDLRATDEPDDDFSPFAARDSGEPKRRGPLLTILLVIVVVAAAAAAFWFLAPPDLKARFGLADSRQTPLQLMMTHSDRQALASGNELLAVSGRVINPTAKAQPVPPIRAELRSKSGQVVYRWTIAPPTATLAPGASARFNSAEVNVPAGGEELTVSLGPAGA